MPSCGVVAGCLPLWIGCLSRSCILSKRMNWNFLPSGSPVIPVFIARQCADARYWYSNSACPSVRPSVAFRYSMKTAQHNVIVFFSPHCSPIILVLRVSNILTNFRRGHPFWGAKYRWGIKILRFSTNIWQSFQFRFNSSDEIVCNQPNFSLKCL